MQNAFIIQKQPSPARYAFHPWATHLPVLCRVLDRLQPKKILELGAGDFSTVILNAYVTGNEERSLLTLENNPDWLSQLVWMGNKQHTLRQVKDWTTPEPKAFDLVLVDQAPEEDRKLSLQQYAETARVVIVHDAHHHDRYRSLFALYAHGVHDRRFDMGTSVLSNYFDVARWFPEAKETSCL